MAVVTLVYRKLFSASHRLHSASLSAEENRKVYGKCNYDNGHGHNYELEVVLRGTPDPKTGMVMNFFELDKILNDKIMARVDHRHFNFDVPEFKNTVPTVENIIVVMWGWLKPELGNILYELRLRETENESAIYRGE
jgi:6-pyruvoyltetrahydropterin/6-carboxytetrahydropterin synthase